MHVLLLIVVPTALSPIATILSRVGPEAGRHELRGEARGPRTRSTLYKPSGRSSLALHHPRHSIRRPGTAMLCCQ